MHRLGSGSLRLGFGGQDNRTQTPLESNPHIHNSNPYQLILTTYYLKYNGTKKERKQEG